MVFSPLATVTWSTLEKYRKVRARQLLDSVKVGRGYKIIIHMNVNYEQFLHPDTQEEFCTADICAGG